MSSDDYQPPHEGGKKMTTGRKRKISKFACERCSKLKKRCDGNFPNPCNRCIAKGQTCNYARKQKRGPKTKRQKVSHKTSSHLQAAPSGLKTQDLSGHSMLLYPHSLGNFPSMFHNMQNMQNQQLFSFLQTQPMETQNNVVNLNDQIQSQGVSVPVPVPVSDVNVNVNVQPSVPEVNVNVNVVPDEDEEDRQNRDLDKSFQNLQNGILSGFFPGPDSMQSGVQSTPQHSGPTNNVQGGDGSRVPIIEEEEDLPVPLCCHVLLGVTGSVAAIKLGLLVGQLSTRRTKVRVKDKYTGSSVEFRDLYFQPRIVLTKSASAFIKEDEVKDIQTYTDVEEFSSWKRKGDPVVHIELRKWSDICCVAPLSANTLTKMSLGLCDNLLLSILKAWDFSKPIVVAPSMNTLMWSHPMTAKQLDVLTSELNVTVVDPVEKILACNELGMGAMANTEDIVEMIERRYLQTRYDQKKLIVEMF